MGPGCRPNQTRARTRESACSALAAPPHACAAAKHGAAPGSPGPGPHLGLHHGQDVLHDVVQRAGLRALPVHTPECVRAGAAGQCWTARQGCPAVQLGRFDGQQLRHRRPRRTGGSSRASVDALEKASGSCGSCSSWGFFWERPAKQHRPHPDPAPVTISLPQDPGGRRPSPTHTASLPASCQPTAGAEQPRGRACTTAASTACSVKPSTWPM
jgi:hypothetical protein